MQQLILIIHVFICIAIVVLVLLQHGKGADAGAAFGSGASQTMFGSQGSTSFLFKVTLGLGALFFATSLLLNNMTAHQMSAGHAVRTTPAPLTQTVPATGNKKT